MDGTVPRESRRFVLLAADPGGDVYRLVNAETSDGFPLRSEDGFDSDDRILLAASDGERRFVEDRDVLHYLSREEIYNGESRDRLLDDMGEAEAEAAISRLSALDSELD